MDTSPLLPTEYVWLPGSTRTRPFATEHRPEVFSVYLSRRIAEDDTSRTVLVESASGFAPLTRRIDLHGDADEGWDWGWRGSAPLSTALNLLLCFADPQTAWRLQWAFCEAFLQTLPPSGGLLNGEDVRTWIRRHFWVGVLGVPFTFQNETAREGRLCEIREESRAFTPRERANRAVKSIVRAARRGAAMLDDDDRSDAARELGSRHQRAAAVLAGAPAEQRWATLALMAGQIPAPGSSELDRWENAASPVTPGLPSPTTVRTVAAVWSRLVGKTAAERAALVADAIRDHADAPVPWDAVPVIGMALGSGLAAAHHGDLCVAGDPLGIAATIAALGRAIAADTRLSAQASSLGLTPSTLREQLQAAHALHTATLRDQRRMIERRAAEDAERILAAERARLPRTRSHRPPPTSRELRRWVLAAPIPVLKELARAARGPAGPLTLRATMAAAGLSFPDPAGTIGLSVAWYLEERAPGLLDLPSFLVRSDGLTSTPAAL